MAAFMSIPNALRGLPPGVYGADGAAATTEDIEAFCLHVESGELGDIYAAIVAWHARLLARVGEEAEQPLPLCAPCIAAWEARHAS